MMLWSGRNIVMVSWCWRMSGGRCLIAWEIAVVVSWTSSKDIIVEVLIPCEGVRWTVLVEIATCGRLLMIVTRMTCVNALWNSVSTRASEALNISAAWSIVIMTTHTCSTIMVRIQLRWWWRIVDSDSLIVVQPLRVSAIFIAMADYLIRLIVKSWMLLGVIFESIWPKEDLVTALIVVGTNHMMIISTIFLT